MGREPSMTTEPTTSNDELAGFWDRILAALIDWNILFAVWIAAWVPLYFPISELKDHPSSFDWKMLWIDVGVIVGWALLYVPWLVYFGLMESGPWQATVGKRMLGLKVISNGGDRMKRSQAFKRAICKNASLWPLPFGLFGIALSSKKMAFHDRLCQTLVIRDKSRYWLGEKKIIMNKSTSIQITNSQGVVLTLGEHLNNVTTQVAQNLHRSEQSGQATNFL